MKTILTTGELYARAARYERGAGFPEDSRLEAAAILREHAAMIEMNARLIETLEEVETICSESSAACRQRMGTRAGNALARVRAAIAGIPS